MIYINIIVSYSLFHPVAEVRK